MNTPPPIFHQSDPFPNITAIISQPPLLPTPQRSEPIPSASRPSVCLSNDDDPFDPIIMSQEDISQVLESIQSLSPAQSPASQNSYTASCPDTLFGHDPLPSQPSLHFISPQCFYCGQDGHYIKDCPSAQDNPMFKKKKKCVSLPLLPAVLLLQNSSLPLDSFTILPASATRHADVAAALCHL